jgi:hypothetical protein
LTLRSNLSLGAADLLRNLSVCLPRSKPAQQLLFTRTEYEEPLGRMLFSLEFRKFGNLSRPAARRGRRPYF